MGLSRRVLVAPYSVVDSRADGDPSDAIKYTLLWPSKTEWHGALPRDREPVISVRSTYPLRPIYAQLYFRAQIGSEK